MKRVLRALLCLIITLTPSIASAATPNPAAKVSPTSSISDQRRNIERNPFYDETAEVDTDAVCNSLGLYDQGQASPSASVAPSASPTPDTTAIPAGTAPSVDQIRAKLLAIKNVGGAARVESIINHLDWYQQAGQEGDVPWQMLVGIHFREGLHFDNPSNGQGAFQLYSAWRAGASFPPGPITKEEWVRQAKIAAATLKGGVNSSPSPINVGKTLNKDTTDTNLIKDVMWAYNGKGARTKAWALEYATELGFNPPDHYLFEGSAYVMNFWDAVRDGMRQCAVDGCSRTNSSANPGAFLFYAALSGYTGGGANSNGCEQTGGGSTTVPNGDKILEIALAEVGHREWDERVLEYTTGRRENWCADFVSWVLKQAGTPFTGGGAGGWQIPAVSNVMEYLRTKGEFHPKDDGYIPQPGDIFIFKSGGRSHTGFVTKYENGRFYTVEGNASNQVKTSSYDMNYSGLTGFGHLK
ncbi:CHAP domain-containing protein [bacterium]|nr:CHAP domain-containing protein [bacterium]